MRVYVSDEAHSSIDKGMDILGLGLENLVKIKTDKFFKINTKNLEDQIAFREETENAMQSMVAKYSKEFEE